MKTNINIVTSIILENQEDLVTFKNILFFASRGVRAEDKDGETYSQVYLKRVSDVEKMLTDLNEQVDPTPPELKKY